MATGHQPVDVVLVLNHGQARKADGRDGRGDGTKLTDEQGVGGWGYEAACKGSTHS